MSVILPILAEFKVSNYNFGDANIFSYYSVYIFYHIFISCVGENVVDVVFIATIKL
jgi:hypothetical protein